MASKRPVKTFKVTIRGLPRDLVSSLYLETTHKNCGIPSQHASSVFDRIRETMNHRPDASLKARLEGILAHSGTKSLRDRVGDHGKIGKEHLFTRRLCP